MILEISSFIGALIFIYFGLTNILNLVPYTIIRVTHLVNRKASLVECMMLLVTTVIVVGLCVAGVYAGVYLLSTIPWVTALLQKLTSL